MAKLTRALVALALVAVTALPAAAQLDPGLRVYELYQLDVKVGEIYVPKHQAAQLYVEHWVLFPGYVYPSLEREIGVRIVASDIVARDVQAFFARSFPAGSRYVEVTAHEADHLPCNPTN